MPHQYPPVEAVRRARSTLGCKRLTSVNHIFLSAERPARVLKGRWPVVFDEEMARPSKTVTKREAEQEQLQLTDDQGSQ